MEPIIAASPEGIRAAIVAQKSQGRLKRLRRSRRHRLSRRPELELRQALNRLVRKLGELVELRVLPQVSDIVEAAPDALRPVTDSRGSQRHDQFQERLTSVIRGVTVTAGTLIDVERLFGEVAGEVNARNLRQTNQTFQSVVGVQPLVSDPWLADLVRDFQLRNASLITNVTQDYMRQVGEAISEAVRSGQRAEQIEEELRKRFVKTENAEKDADSAKLKRRMRLIARDQIASLNADITKARQTQLGIRRFIWRTAKDERVRGPQVSRGGATIGGKYPKARPAHTVLEGQIFDWSKGADGLFPGRPINCRCVAEPVIDDLVEEAGEDQSP